jgi:hypothetical protein
LLNTTANSWKKIFNYGLSLRWNSLRPKWLQTVLRTALDVIKAANSIPSSSVLMEDLENWKWQAQPILSWNGKIPSLVASFLV